MRRFTAAGEAECSQHSSLRMAGKEPAHGVTKLTDNERVSIRAKHEIERPRPANQIESHQQARRESSHQRFSLPAKRIVQGDKTGHALIARHHISHVWRTVDGNAQTRSSLITPEAVEKVMETPQFGGVRPNRHNDREALHQDNARATAFTTSDHTPGRVWRNSCIAGYQAVSSRFISH